MRTRLRCSGNHYSPAKTMARKPTTPSVRVFIGLVPMVILFLTGDMDRVMSQPEETSYSSFTYDASTLPMDSEFDYIVVGGGTSGCPLAATLSESYRVLLLERGGQPQDFPDVMTQDGFLRTLTESDAYDSPAQAFTSEDGVPNARGRVLGGSSAINAGFYSRGDPEFFTKGGCGPVEWDMALVNRSYQWVERAITFQPLIRSWQSAVRDSLLEEGVTPYNGFTVHHVHGTKIGASTFDLGGRRHSAADLLGLANPENIHVALHATVERIMVSVSTGNRGVKSRTATGVVFRDRTGRVHRAHIRPEGEVILSAGALGSPQLLLLSGIGPRTHLTSMGIPVVYNHPYVGEFVKDNPRNGLSISSPVPLEHSLIQVVGITDDGTYIEAASNVLPFYSQTRPVFLRSPSTSPAYVTVATLMEKVSGPASVGFLRLTTLDARDNPAVRFNYFDKPADVERCITGMRRVGRALSGRSMSGFRYPGWERSGRREFRFVGTALPPDQLDNAAMADFCRKSVATIWHYHGGCVAGKVVDADFRVMDIGALRVVDGSTLVSSPGTNPQATLLMMGRYVGEKMKEERALQS